MSLLLHDHPNLCNFFVMVDCVETKTELSDD